MFQTRGKVSSTQISAKIIRADGSIEDLGIISYWHKSFFKRLRFKIKKLFGVIK